MIHLTRNPIPTIWTFNYLTSTSIVLVIQIPTSTLTSQFLAVAIMCPTSAWWILAWLCQFHLELWHQVVIQFWSWLLLWHAEFWQLWFLLQISGSRPWCSIFGPETLRSVDFVYVTALIPNKKSGARSLTPTSTSEDWVFDSSSSASGILVTMIPTHIPAMTMIPTPIPARSVTIWLFTYMKIFHSWLDRKSFYHNLALSRMPFFIDFTYASFNMFIISCLKSNMLKKKLWRKNILKKGKKEWKLCSFQ